MWCLSTLILLIHLIQWLFNWEWFLCSLIPYPVDIWQDLRHFWMVTTGVGVLLLTSHRWRQRCPEQPIEQGIIPVPRCQELRYPWPSTRARPLYSVTSAQLWGKHFASPLPFFYLQLFTDLFLYSRNCSPLLKIFHSFPDINRWLVLAQYAFGGRKSHFFLFTWLITKLGLRRYSPWKNIVRQCFFKKEKKKITGWGN